MDIYTNQDGIKVHKHAKTKNVANIQPSRLNKLGQKGFVTRDREHIYFFLVGHNA